MITSIDEKLDFSRSERGCLDNLILGRNHGHLKKSLTIASDLDFDRCMLLNRGDTLFFPGDTADSIYFVSAGYLVLYRQDVSSQRQVLRLCPPGSMIGLKNLFDNSKHKTQAVTLEKTKVCAIEKDEFVQIIESDIGQAIKVQQILNDYINELEYRLATLSNVSAIVRMLLSIRELLVRHSTQTECGYIINFPVYRQLLAEMTGIKEETVSRIMTNLRERGVLEWYRHRLNIISHEKIDELLYGGNLDDVSA